MKNLLFIHQSSELYGSDKTLLELVSGMKKKGYHPIVVLPGPGPLKEKLDQQAIEVIITPVVKLTRKMFGPFNLLSLPFQMIRSFKTISKATTGRQIDIVYSNTLAVLIGIIYARRKKIKHIWHVHEIVEKPKVIKHIFARLLSLRANTMTIHNSLATKHFWEKNGGLNPNRSVAVWNGLTKPTPPLSPEEILKVRRDLFDCGPQHLVIALVGRINRWKGQMLLLEALKENLHKYDHLRLVYVGSAPPQQEIYLENLNAAISASGLGDKVRIVPFHENIWPVWESVDLPVIPTIAPESFGLVALEAMLCHKPVIAAAHGGLTEIVVHNSTGLLFKPNDAGSLKMALEELISDPEKCRKMGQNGYERASSLFTPEKYVNEIEKICLTL